jgi:anti-anti-sigma factor
VDRAAEFDAQLERLPNGVAVVRVRGELDMATAPVLRETIAGAGAQDLLVIDLGECTFVDSAALRLLTETARDVESSGGGLALVVTDPGIRRVLEITAVDTVLPVHPTVDSALEIT